MSRRYTYSRAIETPEGLEEFSAEQFDSFDEAKKAVDKGINDRRLEIEKQYPRGSGGQPIQNNVLIPPTTNQNTE